MSTNEAIGPILKDLRIERRMKQCDLANRAEIAVGYLSQIESGKKIPGLDVLGRICYALNAPIEYVIMKAGLEKDVEESKRRLFRELEPYFKRFDELYKSSTED